MENKRNTRIIVLAAGQGTRMKSELPKVLSSLKGRSMVERLLDSVKSSGVDHRPVIVVGYEKEKVMAELGAGYEYAVQERQLGTGHAVMSAEKLLENNADHIMVLYGDSPFIKPETIRKLADMHSRSGAKITMATIKLPDFEDWRLAYSHFSRIIRDENSKIIKDVQWRDTTEEEKKITEVNSCTFVFDAPWLWSKLKLLKTDNNQKQYYLTDLVQMANLEGSSIESMDMDPIEGLAANSKEELLMLEKFAV